MAMPKSSGSSDPVLIPYQWYAIHATGATGATVAQLLAHKDRVAIVRYKTYSSFFFRSTQQVTTSNIYGRVKDPRYLPRLAMLFGTLFLNLNFNV